MEFSLSESRGQRYRDPHPVLPSIGHSTVFSSSVGDWLGRFPTGSQDPRATPWPPPGAQCSVLQGTGLLLDSISPHSRVAWLPSCLPYSCMETSVSKSLKWGHLVSQTLKWGHLVSHTPKWGHLVSTTRLCCPCMQEPPGLPPPWRK